MIDIKEIFDLLKTGVIDTYRGEIDVIADKVAGLVVLNQEERIIVLNWVQTVDLIRVLKFKVGEAVER